MTTDGLPMRLRRRDELSSAARTAARSMRMPCTARLRSSVPSSTGIYSGSLLDSEGIERVQTQSEPTGTTADAIRDAFSCVMPDTLMAE